MPTDNEKAKWTGSSNGREWSINYYDCWHCKRCGSELERMCECQKLFDDHSINQWLNCSEREVYQVCPFGCKKIGGLKMFAGKKVPIVRKSLSNKNKKD